MIMPVDNAPGSATARRFIVGPDRDGLWIVCDTEGYCGAVFVDREQALDFVRSECEALRPAVAEWRIVPALDRRSMFGTPGRKVARVG